MIIMFVLLRIARAIATSCFSPALREPWVIGMSRTSSIVCSSNAGRWHRLNTSLHSSVECSFRGSILLLTVPEKSETSWLMIVCFRTYVSQRNCRSKIVKLTMRVLRSSRPSVDMSMPSILRKYSGCLSDWISGHTHYASFAWFHHSEKWEGQSWFSW